MISKSKARWAALSAIGLLRPAALAAPMTTTATTGAVGDGTIAAQARTGITVGIATTGAAPAVTGIVIATTAATVTDAAARPT